MLLPDERKASNPQRLKQVNITFDPETKLLTISPDKVEVVIDPQDNKKSEEVKWNCRGARMEIDFTPTASPFLTYHLVCANGGYCASGVPLKSSIRDTEYSYKVTVTSKDSPRKQVVTQNGRIKVSSAVFTSSSETPIAQAEQSAPVTERIGPKPARKPRKKAAPKKAVKPAKKAKKAAPKKKAPAARK